jgi:hypothetical protein
MFFAKFSENISTFLVRAGIGLNGRTSILARPRVDTTTSEYYLRQFLNEDEAKFLRLLNHASGNYMLAAFRQLNTVPEAQDLTRRCIKQCLTETIGTEVHVFPISGKHLWGQDEDYKEETILIAMTQVEDGGKVLAELMEIPQENPIFRLWFGSGSAGAPVYGYHLEQEVLRLGPQVKCESLTKN